MSDIDLDESIKIDEKISKELKEPSNYNVIMLNDDHTPMEWVMNILTEIFKHSSQSAEEITMNIHNNGSEVVGTYKYEIAEQKLVETTNASRSHGFPLTLKLEEE